MARSAPRGRTGTRALSGPRCTNLAQTAPDGAVTVDPTAVAWLLLDEVGVQKGPTGGDTLTKTTFVQRLNTKGGLAPSTGCSSLTDVGNQAFVPYTADYFFYQKAR